MRSRACLFKVEVMVLILMLMSFIWIYPPDEDKKQGYDQVYYLDINCTAPPANRDGTTLARAWKDWSEVDWGVFQADEYDELCVEAGTYSPANSIIPNVANGNDATIIDINANGTVVIDDTSLSGTDPIVYLDYNNFCDNIRFNGIKFDVATSNRTAAYIVGNYGLVRIHGTRFNECEFDITDSQAIVGLTTSFLTIYDCTFTKSSNGNSIVYLYDSNNTSILKCGLDTSSVTSMSCIIEFEDSEGGWLTENLFILDTSTYAERGIYWYDDCSDFIFVSNVIFGNFSEAVMHDVNNVDSALINFNTFKNLDDSGYGYWIERANPGNIDSFRNNIIYVAATGQNYTLYVDCDPTYWAPGDCAYFDHNNHFSDDSGGTYNSDIYWYGTTYTTAQLYSNTWYGEHSIQLDPNFNTDGYHLTTSTSQSITEGGAAIDNNLHDIDGGRRPVTGLNPSMGADQYGQVVMFPNPSTYPNAGWAVLGTGSPYSDSCDFSIDFYGEPSLTISKYQMTTGTYFSVANGSAPMTIYSVYTDMLSFSTASSPLNTSDYFEVDTNILANHGQPTTSHDIYLTADIQ